MNKAAEQDIDFDATETQDVEGVTKEEETSAAPVKKTKCKPK